MTGPSAPPPAAARVIAALSLPPALPSAAAHARPLPLTGLPALARDGSLLYGLARVDGSGRVPGHEIVGALGWQPGDPLEITASAGAIIIRASADGTAQVPRKPGIVIPAAARHRHAISTGDSVLLAAAPDYGLVVVHTMAHLDDMLARHHAAASPAAP